MTLKYKRLSSWSGLEIGPTEHRCRRLSNDTQFDADRRTIALQAHPGRIVRRSISCNDVTANPIKEGLNLNVDEIIRAYYSGYEQKEWMAVENLLAENFTFTSPNDDDHIDIPTYKARCWPQAEHIEHFELECILQKGNETFVKYLCTTTKGTSFRNIEYFRFVGGKISSIEVYFGGKSGYPSASVTGQP